MPSPTRSTKQRTFSISTEASEAIDDHAERENMSKSMVVETAVLEYLEQSQADRIESKVDEVLERLGGSENPHPPSDGDGTHTHTQNNADNIDSAQTETAESDGGVAVRSPSTTSPAEDPAKIDSFNEYEPSLPEDYYLTEDCLKDAPAAVEDGLAINRDHVEHVDLAGKGTPVRVKTAVCAGVIRYENDDRGTAHEEEIKDVAKDLLNGSRNAKRHFDAITSYLYEGPEDHPEVEWADDLPEKQRIQMGAQDKLYITRFEVLDEAYWRNESEIVIQRVAKPLAVDDPEKGDVVSAQNALVNIGGKPEKFVPYLAPDVDALERVHEYFGELTTPMVDEMVEYDAEFPPFGDD